MTFTIHLPDEQEAALKAKAQAEGVSAEQFAGELVKQALASSAARPSLAARIRGLWADMPDEVRAKLPADGAS
jgi:plasmid stability protein